MTIQMVGKKLLIEPLNKAEKTDGGILIPEPAREASIGTGKVIAAGETLPKEGDSVLYDVPGSVKVNIDGQDLHLVTESQVHAILKK